MTNQPRPAYAEPLKAGPINGEVAITGPGHVHASLRSTANFKQFLTWLVEINGKMVLSTLADGSRPTTAPQVKLGNAAIVNEEDAGHETRWVGNGFTVTAVFLTISLLSC